MNQKAKEILGDYTEFYTLQAQRLQRLGIDIDGLEISHLAFRTETLEEYLVVRQKLESICSANVENTWNGRPISKLLLQEPLQLSRSATTSLIELIPPVHQSVYKMGLEHIAIVIGEAFADFGKLHSHHFTGQQYQTEAFQPYFITFPDHTIEVSRNLQFMLTTTPPNTACTRSPANPRHRTAGATLALPQAKCGGGGARRVFKRFAWLEVDSGEIALSCPTHQYPEGA